MRFEEHFCSFYCSNIWSLVATALDVSCNRSLGLYSTTISFKPTIRVLVLPLPVELSAALQLILSRQQTERALAFRFDRFVVAKLCSHGFYVFYINSAQENFTFENPSGGFFM